jgi:hypothetical protein
MQIEQKVGIEGFIGIRVIDKDGKERFTNIDPETGLGPKNLIVNTGLDMLGTSSPKGASDYCRVGTGTTTPAAGQTDLVSRFGSGTGTITGNTVSNSGAAPWYWDLEREYEFSAGSVDGAALTEVGFFENSSGDMFSRSLIKDGGGTPTSITLTALEVLYVTYVIRVNVPNSDTTGTFTINSDTYNYTCRAAYASTETFWSPEYNLFLYIRNIAVQETQTLGSITSKPSGTQLVGTDSQASYVPGSYQRTSSLTLGRDDGNFGSGIGSFSIGDSSSTPIFQFSVDRVSDGARIPKDNTNTLSMLNAFKVVWSAV